MQLFTFSQDFDICLNFGKFLKKSCTLCTNFVTKQDHKIYPCHIFKQKSNFGSGYFNLLSTIHQHTAKYHLREGSGYKN